MKRCRYGCPMWFRLAAVSVVVAVALPAVAVAQRDAPRRGAVILLEEVVVNARKREEKSQSVPLSITAYNADQLTAKKVRSLESLSVDMPNVLMDDIGTIKGTANFSIRGLGINSSIPSIDPTVGVFIDGVYMGLNQGILFDVFDLESIEVLRGPQGTLFGRNVTGGAVLINTKKPTKTLQSSFRSSLDGGNQGGYNSYLMGSVSGPLVPGTLLAKTTVYYNKDQGWFENQFDGSDFGALEQTMIRPSVVWEPTRGLKVYAKYEYTDNNGDGPASQSHASTNPPTLANLAGSLRTHARDSFDFAIDERGFQKTRSDLVTIQIDVQVGDGTLTNIAGWRDYSQDVLIDVDGQPVNLFHAPTELRSEQWSNELRYNNSYFQDMLNVTVGGYYFTNEINYAERRELLADIPTSAENANSPLPFDQQILDGGGDYEVETFAGFFSFDFDLTDYLTLTAGLRYTNERKEASIASLNSNVTLLADADNPSSTAPALGGDNRCNVVQGTCRFDGDLDLVEDRDWESWAPKVGATYHVGPNARVYGHWSRAFRSGGYNLRNTTDEPTESFDQEQVDNFEIGLKHELRRGRFNVSAFYNIIENMQREVNTADPGAGVVQRVLNTADATIVGLEADTVYALTDHLVFLGSVGWLSAEYTDVKQDLSGDGVIDALDENLELPRAPSLTWSAGLNWDTPINDLLAMDVRFQFAYRDRSFYNDNNRGFILAQNVINAGLDFYTIDDAWTLSVYGNNLLEAVRHGNDTPLPGTVGGGTFAPLSKGRLIGVQLQYDF